MQPLPFDNKGHVSHGRDSKKEEKILFVMMKSPVKTKKTKCGFQMMTEIRQGC